MSATDSPKHRTIHVYGDKLLAHVSPEKLAELDQFELVMLEDDAQFIEALPNIEILFGFKMTGEHWASATNLKLIQLPGAGADSLLPAIGLAKHVIVSNASGVHEPHMPEFVMAQVLALAYQIPQIVRRQDQHRWRVSIPIMSLAGRTMCVVGLGLIGQSIARRAKAFDMRVTGIRRSGEPVDGVDLVATPAERQRALSDADVVVVVTPLTDDTRGLIGADELAALAPGALLVDVSRGGVTDIDAVVDALDSGQLGAACMDVFEAEPLPGDSPLWDVANLSVSPHTAGLSSDYLDRLIDVLIASVAALNMGEIPATAVDHQAGY